MVCLPGQVRLDNGTSLVLHIEIQQTYENDTRNITISGNELLPGNCANEF